MPIEKDTTIRIINAEINEFRGEKNLNVGAYSHVDLEHKDGTDTKLLKWRSKLINYKPKLVEDSFHMPKMNLLEACKKIESEHLASFKFEAECVISYFSSFVRYKVCRTCHSKITNPISEVCTKCDETIKLNYAYVLNVMNYFLIILSRF